MNVKQFVKIPIDLIRANGYISLKTGAAVELTSSKKLILGYMLSRSVFFNQKLGGTHFETQSTIATACGLAEKATGKVLREFIDNGVIRANKLRPNGEGQWRWHYHGVEVSVPLWVGSVQEFSLLDEGPILQKVVANESLPSYVADVPTCVEYSGINFDESTNEENYYD